MRRGAMVISRISFRCRGIDEAGLARVSQIKLYPTSILCGPYIRVDINVMRKHKQCKLIYGYGVNCLNPHSTNAALDYRSTCCIATAPPSQNQEEERLIASVNRRVSASWRSSAPR